MERNTAFLLAAGLGTRLRPLTLARPKPLLPVGGIPMLDHGLAQLARYGHRRVLVNAHHLWPQVAAWAEQSRVDLQVELPEVLGTGGGLRAALDSGRLADQVTVFNGDVLSDVDLAKLERLCPGGGAAMALRYAEDLGTMTPFLVDAHGWVSRIGRFTAMPGAPELPEGAAAGLHFTGVHVMTRNALEEVPAGQPACVIQTAYRVLVAEGRVASREHGGLWFDIGVPQDYLRANLAVLDGGLKLPIDPWSRAERGEEGSLLGVGARVEGRARHSVIGAGAVVPAGARLEDCVVWDGVEVPPGEYRRAVIYDGGAVLEVGAEEGV